MVDSFCLLEPAINIMEQAVRKITKSNNSHECLGKDIQMLRCVFIYNDQICASNDILCKAEWKWKLDFKEPE